MKTNSDKQNTTPIPLRSHFFADKFYPKVHVNPIRIAHVTSPLTQLKEDLFFNPGNNEKFSAIRKTFPFFPQSVKSVMGQ